MKKILLILSAVLFFTQMQAQDAWTQKADVGGVARYQAVGFSIGSKGYIGTGDGPLGAQKDFWEYDPATNAWTQKADFGGVARYQAVGFSIGSKGYIGTGGDNLYLDPVSGVSHPNMYKDFWEYDPATNQWTQKADFGGTARYGATGFSIGSKGYIGIGQDINTNYISDFWEYDPATDAWTRKADYSIDGGLNAVGFSIGSKGYIGTGSQYDILLRNFWEYDPATDHWTLKAGFGDSVDRRRGRRTGATGFSIGSKGYIGTGFGGANGAQKDFWEYDPATNNWTQKADFGGTARNGAVGFSIGSKGYIGTGGGKDFWVYDPAPLITLLSASSFCAGDSVTVQFSTDGTYNAGNTFTAQLSDASGSFASPADIGSISSTASGSISAVIPAGTPAGTAYRIRVVSSDPVFTGPDHGTDLTVTAPATYYVDADNDGYSDGTTLTQCARPTGYKLSTELTATSGDCDDANADINPTTVWYKDADNDGYSDGTTQTQCARPTGYKTSTELTATSGDCNDNDEAINSAIVWYKDADNDGYSDGTTQTQCARPTGYKLSAELTATSGDCDDSRLLYADSDGDGFGAGAPVACGVANNTDCNDGNRDINPTTVWYRDADNDGYYTGSGITQCASPGAGYKSTGLTSGGDCDDSRLLYADSDGDGFGAGAPVACGVANNTDCNDAIGTIYPGATEICANGIDDNCNGLIDENCGSVPRISINDVTVYESEGVAVLTISLDRVSTSAISINYATQSGTAIGSGKGVKTFDFTTASGSVTIAAGTRTAQIRITITKDNIAEVAENFKVNLSLDAKNAKKATITRSSGTVTINNGIKPALTSSQIQSKSNREVISESIFITARPNPSSYQFTLRFNSSGKAPAILRVIDASGRVMETKTQVRPGTDIIVGMDYKPGIYFAVAIQEGKKVVVKLLKQTK